MSNRWASWGTVYTDASVREGRSFVGMRAVWGTLECLSDRPLRIESAIEAPTDIVTVHDSFAAETFGILWGATMAWEAWGEQGLDAVGVRCDSQSAVDLVAKWRQQRRRRKPRRFHHRADIDRICRHFHERLPRHFYVKTNWVKGHQGTGTVQGWLNDRVDALAGARAQPIGACK